MLKILRRIFSLVIFLVSLYIFVWGIMPIRHQMLSQFIEPMQMQLPSTGQAAIPAVLEIRQVRLEWPVSVRLGDNAEIMLIFEPVKSEIIAPKPPADLVDVYESWNIMAEGRFIMAGMQLDPAYPVRESMPSGQMVKLKWQVSAQDMSTYPGKMWLLLRFLPLSGGQAVEVPIYVRDVDIQATSLLGMGGPLARMFGVIGIVLAVLLSIDVMIGWVQRNIKEFPSKAMKGKRDIR